MAKRSTNSTDTDALPNIIQEQLKEKSQEEFKEQEKLNRNHKLIVCPHASWIYVSVLTTGQEELRAVCNAKEKSTSTPNAGAFAESTCKFCGLTMSVQKEMEHLTRCWGRCRRCMSQELICDCGFGPRWGKCSHCLDAGVECRRFWEMRNPVSAAVFGSVEEKELVYSRE